MAKTDDYFDIEWTPEPSPDDEPRVSSQEDLDRQSRVEQGQRIARLEQRLDTELAAMRTEMALIPTQTVEYVKQRIRSLRKYLAMWLREE